MAGGVIHWDGRRGGKHVVGDGELGLESSKFRVLAGQTQLAIQV